MKNISSFGVSESLIISGAFLISLGRSTEGFVSMGLGVLSGFIRFTTWYGISQDSQEK